MRVLVQAVLLFVIAVTGASAQAADPALLARTGEYSAALRAKDAAKVASFYTEDAVSFGEGIPTTKGRAAIAKHFADGMDVFAAMTYKIIDASTSGDLG